MATLIVCPRCRGAVQPDAHACPRCGLVLDGLRPEESSGQGGYSQSGTPSLQATAVDYGQNGASQLGGTLPYAPSSPPPAMQSAAPQFAPQTGPRVVPRGAIELLPEESVAFQLGALYLTNKRVILLAPSVVRAAFLRDVDAVGTLTEKASGWSLFFGLLSLGVAAAAAYLGIDRAAWEPGFPFLFVVEPFALAGVLAIAGLALLVLYFVWIKRTLFVSVSGRPLITVSVSDWNTRKLEGMDSFVNAFFQVKDAALEEQRP